MCFDQQHGSGGGKDKSKISQEALECLQAMQKYIPMTQNQMQALHSTQHKELWTALRQLADDESSFKTIIKAVELLETRAKQKTNQGSKAKSSGRSGASAVLRAITYRLSMGIVSNQAVPLLMASLRARGTDRPALLSLLHEVSAIHPSFFAAASDDLASLLNDEQDPSTLDLALRMLAHVGKHGLNWPPDLRGHLSDLCIHGKPQQAKHAVLALSCIYGNKKQDASLFPKLAKKLVSHLKLDQRECGPALAALAQIAKTAPAALVPLAPTFLPWISGDLLAAAPPRRRQTSEASHQSRLKQLGLRLLTNYTLANHEGEEGAERSRETLRILLDLIRDTEPEEEEEADREDEGDKAGESGSRQVKADGDRELVRKHAVGSLLRLMQVREVEAMLGVEDYHLAAFTVRDPVVEVREHIVEKLWAGIKHPTKLGLKWVAMLGLIALDSDKKLLHRARGYLTNAIRVRQQAAKLVKGENGRALFSILPEYAFPYFIHLLAHRRDWEDDAANKYQDSTRYDNPKYVLWGCCLSRMQIHHVLPGADPYQQRESELPHAAT